MITEAPVFALPGLVRMFVIECDISNKNGQHCLAFKEFAVSLISPNIKGIPSAQGSLFYEGQGRSVLVEL